MPEILLKFARKIGDIGQQRVKNTADSRGHSPQDTTLFEFVTIQQGVLRNILCSREQQVAVFCCQICFVKLDSLGLYTF